VPGQQHRVGQEGHELPEVVRTALPEVGGRVGDDTCGDARGVRELRVDRALPAHRDERDVAFEAGGVQSLEALPGPEPAEQAHDDE